jgi:hypothetical protein
MKQLAALGVAALASVLLAVPAEAGKTFDSKVTIEFQPGELRAAKRVDAFAGKVKSDKGACENKRKVVLFSKQGGSKTKVGSFTTGPTGVWSVETSFEEPHYFAKVKERKLSAGLCKSDTSKTLDAT